MTAPMTGLAATWRDFWFCCRVATTGIGSADGTIALAVPRSRSAAGGSRLDCDSELWRYLLPPIWKPGRLRYQTADDALYEAKAQGRNRVVCSSHYRNVDLFGRLALRHEMARLASYCMMP